MKLLWVSHFLPYPSTGHGALQRTHHLVRQLSSAFEVELFALSNGDGGERDLLDMGVRRATVVPFPGTLRKVAALAASTATGAGYWNHLFANRALHAALARAVTPESVVLLDTVFLAPYLRHAKGATLVLNHHNVESALLAQRAEGESGVRRAFFARQAAITRAMEQQFAQRARVNLVVSSEDAARLAEVAPRATTCVVPNGVDVDFFQSRPAASITPHSLVYAGGMNWFPNREAIQWLATEIWPRLVAAEPRRTLTIIGKSPPPEAVALAERDRRVTVTGFVPDVRPYIERASAYICPIRIGGGTRLKVLDALAMRRPLVATGLSVDGLGMTPDTHYLLANEPDQFVRALARLDADEAVGARLADAGRQLVEAEFSWQRIGRDLIAALPRWIDA
ncbi:MAG: glycosyltransferase [Gemmatimonadaceae bacterium]|nr:glycosyltransferase [Gemmatimonadaceae bacterium]